MTAFLVTGCGLQNDDNVSDVGPAPINGGTLYLSQDSRHAVVSDPARGSIFLVSLSGDSGGEERRIELAPRSQPGRAIEDAAGRVHVVLRGTGEVLSLSLDNGDEVGRRFVCGSPEGIAFESSSDDLLVACSEGHVARLPAGGGDVSERIGIEPDLRDIVVLSDRRMLVSRFRSADVLVVEDGAVVDRWRPADSSGFSEHTARVAWRLRADSEGGAFLVHQMHETTQLGTLGTPSGQYYGGSCDLGVVRSAVTQFNARGRANSAYLDDTTLPVDVAATARTLYVASAAEPGFPDRGDDLSLFPASTGGLRTLPRSSLSDSPSCQPTNDPVGSDRNAAVAVASNSDGAVLVQYRDPAELVFMPPGQSQTRIGLSGGRVQHAGHALFHEAAGDGIACASCHPGGGDDGHVWLFDVGTRRTPTLRGGILETAPFHWAGDVSDVTAVMRGTFVGRMSGAMPTAEEVESLGRWLDALPKTGTLSMSAGAARGQTVFEEQCTSCHAGEAGTNNLSLMVGTGGRFQVPPMREMLGRAPYLHDGSALTLEDAVAGHAGGGVVDASDRRDLADYLRTR